MKGTGGVLGLASLFSVLLAGVAFAATPQMAYQPRPMVPAGTCTQAYADYVAENSVTSDVQTALTLTPTLESWLTSHNIAHAISVGVDQDYSPMRLDVVCEDGYTTFGGYQVTDAAYVSIQLQLAGLQSSSSPTGIAFQGVPVETSTVATSGLMSDGNFTTTP